MTSSADEKKENALLSVIVPVYNLENYLDTCVDSILKETYGHLELLLVDDGSTDASGACCDKWADRDGRVRVFHTENRGRAQARNLALENAKGEWIGFVDGDDWIEPEFYETLIALCRENDAQMGECTFRYVFKDRTVSAGNSGKVTVLTRQEALTRISAQEEVRFEVAPKVFHRQAVEGVRFVPGQLFEEIHFTRMSLNQTRRFVSIDRDFYQYRQQREGNTNSIFPPEKLLILQECDDMTSSLREEGLTAATEGMEAFTLDFIIRLYVNALANHASREVLDTLKKEYRARFYKARGNAQVKKLRGALFSFSPWVYNQVSMRLHKRD